MHPQPNLDQQERTLIADTAADMMAALIDGLKVAQAKLDAPADTFIAFNAMTALLVQVAHLGAGGDTALAEDFIDGVCTNAKENLRSMAEFLQCAASPQVTH